MADLSPIDDRESWLEWASERGPRGLWPRGEITVHGPHPPPADCLWGAAECRLLERISVEVEFYWQDKPTAAFPGKSGRFVVEAK